MSEVVIRGATIDDAPKLAEVYVRTANVSERGILPDAFLDARTPQEFDDSWVRRITAPAPHATWIAEVAGRAVGLVYVEPSRDDDATPATGHLDMLYVLPDHAGQGIGTALLARGLGHLRQSGFCEATLWVLAANAAARRFYQRAGWRPTDVTLRVEEDGFAADIVRYVFPLQAPSAHVSEDDTRV